MGDKVGDKSGLENETWWPVRYLEVKKISEDGVKSLAGGEFERHYAICQPQLELKVPLW